MREKRQSEAGRGRWFRIGRVRVSVTDEDRAVADIKDAVSRGAGGYVCVSTLRTVRRAARDDSYWRVMERSLMNTPDGTPLVWCARWWGLRGVGRACGPHIFPRLLADHDPGLRHYFLGDTDETLAALRRKAEEELGASVAGTCSPPFAPLEEYDIDGIARRIRESGATLVWTSLRAPKQDMLDAMLSERLGGGVVLVGVGAAFRSFIGGIKPPDGLLQRMGLAGLVFRRPGVKPWQLAPYYFRHSLFLAGCCLTILWRRMRGRKCWE